MVNTKPSEIFEYDFRPENFKGEVIFVLDRSESMGWNCKTTLTKSGTVLKIETLRNAMCVALASSPERCAFNIVSFGTDREFLWEESKPFSKHNLTYAMNYVSTNVRPNMHGTEMLPALQEAVESRSKDRSSTQIIIVTDGELEDIGITDFVFKTRRDYQDRIRFFALGIGEEVSHRLIESIGEFGGGYSEVINITTKSSWEDRLIRMLKFGVAPDSWAYNISLGPGFERRSLLDYRFRQKPRENKVVSYIQATYPTPAFHPFAYRSLFFLLDIGSKMKSLPTCVTLKPRNADSKAGAKHSLHVQPTWTDRSTIHHLAVKAALIGLEAEANQKNPNAAQSDVGRQNAELLGEMFSIASKWTSFAVVDRKTETSDVVNISKAEMINIDLNDLEASAEFDVPRDWGSDSLIALNDTFGPSNHGFQHGSQ